MNQNFIRLVSVFSALTFAAPALAIADPSGIPPGLSNASDGTGLLIGILHILNEVGQNPRARQSQRQEKPASVPTGEEVGGYCGVTENGSPYTGAAR